MNLKTCIANMKEKMSSTAQHIHPMIVEDMT